MKFLLPLILVVILCAGYRAEFPENEKTGRTAVVQQVKADVRVTDLQVGGQASDYTFFVSLRSDDTGCAQYADWWEVVDTRGHLVYRRILAHSHPGEQPFTRPGGPVDLEEDQVVYIRGHMNKTGYGSGWFKGSVRNGFSPVGADPGFAPELDRQPPLPKDCAF